MGRSGAAVPARTESTPRRRTVKNITTRILLTCAAIGVAFGVLGIANSVLMGALALAAPPFYPVLSGVYLLPGVVAAALIRRPGVAILAQVLAGLVAIGTTSAIASILVATVLWALLGRAIAPALRRTGVGSFPAPARGR